MNKEQNPQSCQTDVSGSTFRANQKLQHEMSSVHQTLNSEAKVLERYLKHYGIEHKELWETIDVLKRTCEKSKEILREHYESQKTESQKTEESAIVGNTLLEAVDDQKIDLIKEYLDPTGVTITELMDRNAFASLCQLLDAYLLEAVRKYTKLKQLKK